MRILLNTAVDTSTKSYLASYLAAVETTNIYVTEEVRINKSGHYIFTPVTSSLCFSALDGKDENVYYILLRSIETANDYVRKIFEKGYIDLSDVELNHDAVLLINPDEEDIETIEKFEEKEDVDYEWNL